MNGIYNDTLKNVINNLNSCYAEIDWHDKQRVNTGANYVTLYASKSIMSHPNFSKTVKYAYSKQIFIGFAYDNMSTIDAMINYNKLQPIEGRVTHAVTEYEPYNGIPGTYADMTVLLKASYPKLKAAGITSAVYMGWPVDSYWDTIVAYTDQIMLHCYKKSSSMTESKIWEYVALDGTGKLNGRLVQIAKSANKLNKKVQVNIIYSTEALTFGAGNEFAGIWFKTHPWWDAQKLFMSAWDKNATPEMTKNVRATGCYIFVTKYAKQSRS